MHTRDDFIDIGAPTPFSPPLAEGVQRLLGERPHAARHILPVPDGGSSHPAPKPKPKPKPAPAPVVHKPVPSTPTTSTDHGRTGAHHVTPKPKPKPTKTKPPTDTAPHKSPATYSYTAPKPKKHKPTHTKTPTNSMPHKTAAMYGSTTPTTGKHGKKSDPAPQPLDIQDEVTQLKIAAAKNRLKLERQHDRKTDGKHLDKQVPPDQRGEVFTQQQKFERKVKRLAAPPKPPKGLTGQALHVWNELESGSIAQSNRTKAQKAQEKYWAKHDTYVDKDGVVYSASFNTTTGKLDLERHDDVDTRPPHDQVTGAKTGQKQLNARIKKAQDKLADQYNSLPGGIRRFNDIDGGPSLTQQQDALADKLKAKYYKKHPMHVGKDGTVYVAKTDPTTGTVVFDEQPNSITLTRTQNIDVDGSRVKTSKAHGWLSNGYDESTQVEYVDSHGHSTGATTNHHRDTTTHNVETILDEDRTFDAKGVQTSGDTRLQIHDRNTHLDTDANTHFNFRDGRLTDTHATMHVEGPADDDGSTLVQDSTTDTKYNRKGIPTWMHATGTTTVEGSTKGEGDDPDVDWKTVEKSDTLLDGKGKPIYKPDGTLAVIPQMTLDRETTSTYKGEGQDDGTDLIQVVTSHAESDDTGELVFDKYSHTEETSEGKDGDKGRSWDTPIDTTTGAMLEEPPADWQPEGHATQKEIDEATPDGYGGYVDKDGNYLVPPLKGDDLTEAWQQQNTDDWNHQSGWRKFKDGATKVAAVGAAVLGTALLFTGVGTPLGAGLLMGSAALGAVAFASTASDYATGRNHISGTDVALSAAMMIPGVGGGAGRFAAGAARFAKSANLVEDGARFAEGATRVAKGFDTAGKVMTYGWAAADTGMFANKIISGEGVGTMDVLNLLAAYGGAKHARGKAPAPRMHETTGAVEPTSTTTGAPRVRVTEPTDTTTSLPLTGDHTPVRGGGGAPHGDHTSNLADLRDQLSVVEERLAMKPDQLRRNSGDPVIRQHLIRSMVSLERQHAELRGRIKGLESPIGHEHGPTPAPDSQVGGAHGDGVDATPRPADDLYSDPTLRQRSDSLRSGVDLDGVWGRTDAEVLGHVSFRHSYERRASHFQRELDGLEPEQYVDSHRDANGDFDNEVVDGQMRGGIFREGMTQEQLKQLTDTALEQGVWLPSSRGAEAGQEIYFRSDEVVGYDSRARFKLGEDGSPIIKGQAGTYDTNWVKVVVGADGVVRTTVPVRSTEVTTRLNEGANSAEGAIPAMPGTGDNIGRSLGGDVSEVAPVRESLEAPTDVEPAHVLTDTGEPMVVRQVFGSMLPRRGYVMAGDGQGAFGYVRLTDIARSNPVRIREAIDRTTAPATRVTPQGFSSVTPDYFVSVRGGRAEQFTSHGQLDMGDMGLADGVYVQVRNGYNQVDFVPFAEWKSTVADRTMRVSRTQEVRPGDHVEDGWIPVGREDGKIVLSNGEAVKRLTPEELADLNADRLLSEAARIRAARKNGTPIIQFRDAQRGVNLGTQFTVTDHTGFAAVRAQIVEGVRNLMWGNGFRGIQDDLTVNLDAAPLDGQHKHSGAYAHNGAINFTQHEFAQLNRATIGHELGHIVSEGYGNQNYATPAGRRVEELEASIIGSISARDWNFEGVYDLSQVGRIPNAANNYREYLEGLGIDGRLKQRPDGVHRDALFLSAPFVRLQQASGWGAVEHLMSDVLNSGKVRSVEDRAQQIRWAAAKRWGANSREYYVVDKALNDVGVPRDLVAPQADRLDLLNGRTRLPGELHNHAH